MARYRVRWINGIRVMEHRIVWEKYHGRKIPDNCKIHHRDGNGRNNSVENLQLVSCSEHSRIHFGWGKRGNEWLKCCPSCHQYKSMSEYFIRKDNRPREICKVCDAKRSLLYQKTHPEKHNARSARYYRLHKEEIMEKQRLKRQRKKAGVSYDP